MNKWKEELAIDTPKRTLLEAVSGSDVFIGVSVKGALTPEMLKNMNKDPIIFAMANPDPEIVPEEARAIRPDAIVATGRSDYPNQINNVLCFPYIFRGALDAHATDITEGMKLAAAIAIAESVSDADLKPEFVVPSVFDRTIVERVAPAVAAAAIKDGVIRKR